MNFKRIAWSVAAALAVPGFVHAEDESSLINVYGHIALGVEKIEATGKTKFDGSEMLKVDPSANSVNFALYNRLDGLPQRTRVTDGISYIGFRGNQELGSGFTALYQIETAVKPDDGCGYVGCENGEISKPAGAKSARFANRQSFVGLRNSSLGTLQYGRLDMYFDKHVPNEIHLLKSGASSTALSVLGYAFNSGASFGGYLPFISAAGATSVLAAQGLPLANAQVLGSQLKNFSQFALPFYNVGNRASNVVQYRTPSVKGLQAVLAYQVPEAKGAWYKGSDSYGQTFAGFDQNNSLCRYNEASPSQSLCLPGVLNQLSGARNVRNDAKELTIAYFPGWMFASLAYLEEKDPIPLVAGGAIDKAYGIKGSLGFQVAEKIPLRLGVVYERQVNQFNANFANAIQALGAASDPNAARFSVGDASRDTYVFAASYKFTEAMELIGTWARAKDTKTFTGQVDQDSGATYIQATALYNFSKRTNLFATYAKVNNDKIAAYNFFINAAATSGDTQQAPFLQTPRGSDPTSIQVGVSHNF